MNGIPHPIVQLFADVAPEIYEHHFPLIKNRCCNATRVLVDVMQAFKVEVKPLSVDTIYSNKAYLDQIKMLGRVPIMGQDELMHGAWAVGIDTRASATDSSRNAWAGHLVGIVENRLLVDPNAGQFSRPQKNLLVPEIVVLPCERKFYSKGKGRVVFTAPDETTAMYMPRKDDTSYRDVSGWQRSPWNAECARDIINTMKKRL